MSTTTTIMLNAETAISLLFFSIVFLFVILMILYIFWKPKEKIIDEKY